MIGVELIETTGGQWLTLWDVFVAIMWIVGGHLIVHNLSALYEFLVFPLIGGTDRGGRFVVLALSRFSQGLRYRTASARGTPAARSST